MEIKVIRSDDEISHVSLVGRMDHNGATEIEQAFVAATAGRQKPTVVELGEVTFIVSLGIRVLLGAAKSLSANGHKIALVNSQPLVAETLRLAKLDDIFVLTNDVDDAIEQISESAG
ncbi:MAG: STAS domain-containing protein [Verrucomicrobiota bacterium]